MRFGITYDRAAVVSVGTGMSSICVIGLTTVSGSRKKDCKDAAIQTATYCIVMTCPDKCLVDIMYDRSEDVRDQLTW